MKGFFNLFTRSAKEIKNIRSVCVTALLIALDIAIKMLTSIYTISVGDTIKISFAFVVLASIGMLYGPTMAFAAGAITDIIGFLVKPTGAFDIRYTFIEALGALIYGIFLYNAVNDKWLLPRIVAAKSTVVIICNLWLTTWANASISGKGILALLPARAIKNFAQLPVDIFILAVFLPIILKAYTSVFKGARKIDANTIFSESGISGAMIYIICIILIAICCMGLVAQDLKDKNTELKKQVAEMQTEIDALYDGLGIEKPSATE